MGSWTCKFWPLTTAFIHLAITSYMYDHAIIPELSTHAYRCLKQLSNKTNQSSSIIEPELFQTTQDLFA